MKKGGLLVLLGLVSSWLALGSAQPVTAQTSDPFHISISPPVAYIQVKPGDSLTHAITVQHKGTVPLTVTPILVDFSASQTGQGISLTETSTFPYLTAESKKQTTDAFTLNPGEKRTVALTFNPPSGVIEHEYHLTLLFKTQPATNEIPAIGAEVTGTIGSNVVVLISNGDRNRGQLHVREMKLPRLVDSLSGLSFTLSAENSGVMATQATGSATISDWRNQVVAEFQIYPDMVLANSSRLLRPSLPATASAQPPDQQTQPNVPLPQDSPEFKYKPWFLLGPYTVTVELGANGTTSEPTSYQVIALPFSLLLLAIVGAVVYLIYTYFKPKLPLGK
jgi:hypothetical protein